MISCVRSTISNVGDNSYSIYDTGDRHHIALDLTFRRRTTLRLRGYGHVHRIYNA